MAFGRSQSAELGPNVGPTPAIGHHGTLACDRAAATSTLAGDAQTDPADLGGQGVASSNLASPTKQSTPPDLVGPAFDRHSLPEALGQQHGQVVEEEMVELGRLRKGAVGTRCLIRQPGQHLLEPGLDLGGRSVDVDQPGHAIGQDELVLELGDVQVGGHPAVALPVDADEHLGLARWSGNSARGGRGRAPSSNMIGRQPELLDGASSRLALVRQLA
jgi:hypothetical protein